MYAQQLRTPITLQAQASTQDALGQTVGTWQDLRADWADVRTLGGLETLKANAQTTVTRASARIRWCTDLAAGMRVLMSGQPWHITAVLPDLQRRRHVDLSLELAQ